MVIIHGREKVIQWANLVVVVEEDVGEEKVLEGSDHVGEWLSGNITGNDSIRAVPEGDSS